MLGWMDREALRRTLTEGRVTFWSRSRQEYWRKGDTSGHAQYVRAAALDCDADTLLVQVEQVGVACHTGTRTCFDGDPLDRRRRLAAAPTDDDGGHDDGRRRHDRASTTSPRLLRRPPGRARRPRALRRRRDARRHLPQARRAAARAPSCSSPPSRAASGRGTRSSASSSFGVLTEHDGTRASGSTTASTRERALGDASDGLRAARRARARCTSAGRTDDVPGASAAHRRARRLHRLGGDPPDRAPAEPPAGRLRRCPGRRSASSPSSSSSTTAPAPCSSSPSVLNDGADAADALWADAQARLDALQARARRSRPRPGSPRSTCHARPTPRAPHRDGRLPRRRRALEGVHPRRRRLPGRHLAALRPRGHGRPDRRVPRAAQPQPEPVHVPAAPRGHRRASRTGSSARRPRRSSRSQDGRVYTHPIAGSKPRGATPEEDVDLEAELARRPQGAGRAPHARRPRPQRPAQGLRRRHRSR